VVAEFLSGGAGTDRRDDPARANIVAQGGIMPPRRVNDLLTMPSYVTSQAMTPWRTNPHRRGWRLSCRPLATVR
jgi:hypothetical protein